MTRLVTYSLAALLLILSNNSARGQEPLPILKANSTSVDIQDGHNFRKGHWGVAPGIELDVYYAQRSTREKRVTFQTDVDSISFDVKPGENYDFIILLDGKHRCPTRISALRTSARKEHAGDPSAPAVIPFEFGADHKMHLRGSLNDSEPLDFVFDTGADTTVIYPSALKKEGMGVFFDGDQQNIGLGGSAMRRTSNDNQLAIANLRWDHELVMSIPNQADDADGIIGYNIFEDKVVEIDFDRMVMLIHDQMPRDATNFAKSELHFPGTIPCVTATLGIGGNTIEEWFVYDTGYSGSVYLTHAFAKHHALDGTMKWLGTNRSSGVNGSVPGEYVELPAFTLGSSELQQIPISIETASTGEHNRTGLLGMDVLKRYHVFLDFQNNEIYLKPSGLHGQEFMRPHANRRLMMMVGLSTTIALILMGWIASRRRHKVPRRGSDAVAKAPIA
jgi:hypothetical protein